MILEKKIELLKLFFDLQIQLYFRKGKGLFYIPFSDKEYQKVQNIFDRLWNYVIEKLHQKQYEDCGGYIP